MAASLEKYLDAHDLQKTLNALLNDVAAARPAQPYAWMADQLAPKAQTSWPAAHFATEDVTIQGMPGRWRGVATLRGRA